MERDFENLNAFKKIQYNHILDQNKARDTRLKPVREKLKSYYIIDEIWEVNDFQIVKIRRKRDEGKEVMYATFVNYESLNLLGMTFDQALLICLAFKYDGYNSQFPIYAARMLNAKFEPEQSG